MSSNFKESLEHTLHWEGRYSNDPLDPGGATNFGITQRTLDRWRVRHVQFPLDVRDLSRAQAGMIYLEWYWNFSGCHLLRPALGLAVFDAAVNHGPRTASKMLQRGLGVVVDGVIGPKTAAASRRKDTGLILLNYHTRRVIKYIGLTSFGRFGSGWVARALDTHRVAMLIWDRDR